MGNDSKTESKQENTKEKSKKSVERQNSRDKQAERKLSIIEETNESNDSTQNVTVTEESSATKQEVKLMSEGDIEKADKLLEESKEMIKSIKQNMGVKEVEEKKVRSVEADQQKAGLKLKGQKKEVNVNIKKKEIKEEQIKPLRAEEGVSLKSKQQTHKDETVSKVQVKKTEEEGEGLEDGDNEVMDGDMIDMLIEMTQDKEKEKKKRRQNDQKEIQKKEQTKQESGKLTLASEEMIVPVTAEKPQQQTLEETLEINDSDVRSDLSSSSDESDPGEKTREVKTGKLAELVHKKYPIHVKVSSNMKLAKEDFIQKAHVIRSPANATPVTSQSEDED